MVKTLLLMRHGEAEQSAASGSDADRALTDAGRRALKAKLPQVVGLISSSTPIRVWASPLVRARQTALLLASHLDDAEVSLHPVLASGDIDGFLDEVACCPDQTVVAVGHNPFAEQLAARLGGVAMPFGKGALAAFELTADATSGELLWFVQGPHATRWATLCRLEDLFGRAARRVWKARKRFLDDPDDIKRLHALRISIRTMRSLLSFAAPFQRKSWNAVLQGDLRSLVRLTSRLRDLDVLCGRVRKASGPATALSPEEAEGASLSDGSSPAVPADPGLEAVLVRMREKERDRVVAALGSRRLRRAAQRVRRSTGDAIWRTSIEREGLAKEDLQVRFIELVDAFQSACENLDFSDFTALHSLRKRVKLLRYVANELGPLIGEEAESMVQQMTAMQDELGALCDAWASQQTIASIDRTALSSSAVRELQMLEEQDEDRLRSVSRRGGEPSHKGL